MRVVVVKNMLPPYRLGMLNAMQRLGLDIHVVLPRLTHPGRRDWQVNIADAEFTIHRLKTLGFEARRTCIDITLGTASKLDQIAPDVLVVAGWDVHASWSALSWGRRNDVPRIAWSEASANSGSFRGRVSTAARRAFVRSCQAALVPGRLSAEFIYSLDPALSTFMLPNTVDTGLFQRASCERPHRGRVLFVGALDERKGFDAILDGAGAIEEVSTGVDIVGTGPLESRLRTVIRERGSWNYYGPLGPTQVAHLMQSASVLLLPSRQDPWPLVAVEALACGTPLALGPGVASYPDLKCLAPAAVAQMGDLQPAAIQRAIAAVSGAVMSPKVPSALSHEAGAEAFSQAVREVHSIHGCTRG